jgi:membrane-associated phospholipid phosphatase
MAGTSAQLLGGLGALAAAAVAGLAFVHRPWPNRLDVWGYAVLPADPASHWAHDLVAAGSLVALIGGVAAVFAVAILRDWVRAVACATAPVLAVLIVQDLAKPLVGRHLGITGSASYPSGTVAAVAALMTAAVLVTPKVARPLVAMAGAAVTAGVCAAVVVLRWHYPTDALGGVAVGVGAVLVLDALAHLPWAVAGLRHGRGSRRRVGAAREPRWA